MLQPICFHNHKYSAPFTPSPSQTKLHRAQFYNLRRTLRPVMDSAHDQATSVGGKLRHSLSRSALLRAGLRRKKRIFFSFLSRDFRPWLQTVASPGGD
jgi:hypothetical protein